MALGIIAFRGNNLHTNYCNVIHQFKSQKETETNAKSNVLFDKNECRLFSAKYSAIKMEVLLKLLKIQLKLIEQFGGRK